MSNNKQSSVDWLIDELNRIQELYYGQSIIPIEVITKAKAMHREEIIDATCLNDYVNEDDREIGERYYNETYGGNNDNS